MIFYMAEFAGLSGIATQSGLRIFCMFQTRTVAHFTLHILQSRRIHLTDESPGMVESGNMAYQALRIKRLVDPVEGFVSMTVTRLAP